MSERSDHFGSRLLDACLGVFLGALALYGAVQLLAAVWVPLSIAVFVVALVGGIGFTIHWRMRRW